MPSRDADPLNADTPAGYGTLPSPFTQNGGRKVVRGRRAFPALSILATGQIVPGSTVSSPGTRRPTSLFANLPPFHRQQTTYDPPLSPKVSEEPESGGAARVNGIRVWYSSFTSIDWLHDAVEWKNEVYVLQKANNSYRRSKIRGGCFR